MSIQIIFMINFIKFVFQHSKIKEITSTVQNLTKTAKQKANPKITQRQRYSKPLNVQCRVIEKRSKLATIRQ